MKPLVTVGVRSFSYAPFIRRCLNSLAAQDFPHAQMEVIVVQDAGRAPPVSWTRKRVHISKRTARRAGRNFRFESLAQFAVAPVGHGEMFNIILSLAKGEVVVFVDSDDFILPSHVRELYAALQRSSTDAVSANCEKRWFDQFGNPLSGKSPEPVLVTDENYTDFGALLCVRADRARATGGLISGAGIGEDREWLLRTDSCGRRLISWASANTPPKNYVYVQHPRSHPVDREAEWKKLRWKILGGELKRPAEAIRQCETLDEYFQVRPLPPNLAARVTPRPPLNTQPPFTATRVSP